MIAIGDFVLILLLLVSTALCFSWYFRIKDEDSKRAITKQLETKKVAPKKAKPKKAKPKKVAPKKAKPKKVATSAERRTVYAVFKSMSKSELLAMAKSNGMTRVNTGTTKTDLLKRLIEPEYSLLEVLTSMSKPNLLVIAKSNGVTKVNLSKVNMKTHKSDLIEALVYSNANR